MEDWSYAGSWENFLNPNIFPIKICNPKVFFPYNQTQTIYNNDSLRSMTYIIETDDLKQPLEKSLGNNLFIDDESNIFLICRPYVLRPYFKEH